MKDKWFNALERVFAAEIDHRLPLQSKAAVYPELESVGLVEHYSVNMGGCKVSGYGLTHLGRMQYCASCKGIE